MSFQVLGNDLGQAVVLRWVAWKAGSFDDVFAEHFDFVWSNLRRLGVDDAQLDDALQDVFVAVHRHFSVFSGGSRRGWLFQFVLRVAATHRRTVNNATKMQKARAEEVGPTSASLPDEELEARQARDVLHRLLGELSEEHRAVFVLAVMEEMPMVEVAETLNLNVNTASSRLREARRALNESMVRERAREEWRLR